MSFGYRNVEPTITKGFRDTVLPTLNREKEGADIWRLGFVNV
jgi:hypothetical protein